MTGGPPLVGVIVLNWRQPEVSLRCLASVAESTYPNLRVYFVDNGSGDGSPGRIREAFPAVQVIETGENLGYAGGNNRGIEQSLADGCDYVFILNNDAVVAADCVALLAAAGQANPRAGLLQPVILAWQDGERRYALGRWRPRWKTFRKLQMDDPLSAGTVTQCSWASGCALFCCAALLRETGGFDEDFFLCWEEIDLAFRAAERGWSAGVVHGAEVRHEGSVSFGGREAPVLEYFNRRNRLLWASRHLPPGQRASLYRSDATAAFRAVLGVLRRVRSPDPVDLARLAAFRDAIFRRKGDAPEWVWRLKP